MTSLSRIAPLLVAAGILLAGNGIQATLLAVRAELEGFSPAIVGAMGTAYFLGFLFGTAYVNRLINLVGHIRVFASLAAVAAAGTLTLAMCIDAGFWIAMRFVMGLCFSGLFTVVESWLNDAADNSDRGRVLSIYRLVDLGAVAGSQLILPMIGVSGFEVFSLMAILLCLSLVPISMSRRQAPTPGKTVRFDLRQVWEISPIASIGVFAIGLSTSAFRTIGPLYASGIGLELHGVAYFMTAGIVGGAVLLYPLGMLSDRWDRRWVLIIATVGASISGAALALLGTKDPTNAYTGIFLFGAFALPLYSLCVAHANDHAEKGQFALLSAGLIFIYSLGASVGPLAGSLMIEWFGPSALFGFICVVHLALVALTLMRMAMRPAVPSEDRVTFTPLMRTSPVIFRLAKRQLTRRSGVRPRSVISTKLDGAHTEL